MVNSVWLRAGLFIFLMSASNDSVALVNTFIFYYINLNSLSVQINFIVYLQWSMKCEGLFQLLQKSVLCE